MEWLGIGVLILAIAIAVGIGFLIPVLNKLTKTLDNTAQVIGQAEKSLEDITGEVKLVLYNTNETLLDVNQKVKKLDPIFDTIEDAGNATHHLTATLAQFTDKKMKNVKDGIDVTKQKNVKGLVRAAAFFYYLRKKKK
ncbi:hypothetical protein AJ85_16690 [Alkalihalobacillus alcalophilus ATCC 27647 = CGMCC 1.3604]|uniref:General stress protein n=1 Tax=Alkalihalobacillus alcalophilus ATCC 27647 = CGMCC 1.3604 TaxID=1218173 RepID=A0A4S4K3B1_ALKAL|nr:DUF948 domain-containing protein [Alkalihalobacillus alcalophilus]MED1562507.1 DUF948 domain-containing protein [Alkalihalobacillus alcalophilus]THG92154.1 hypothetical protein AJ85_16690 [Alkalihalobacillus alcalophilus ATCC 27647 = CGMCC 1.3604]